MFLEFACEIGAIGESQKERLAQRCDLALNELIARQTKYHQTSDPALRFLSLLRAAAGPAGGAHVSDRQGKVPEEPATWGWRRKSGRAWVPQGARIGWLDGPNLYLEPTISYEVVQQIAGTERLPVRPNRPLRARPVRTERDGRGRGRGERRLGRRNLGSNRWPEAVLRGYASPGSGQHPVRPGRRRRRALAPRNESKSLRLYRVHRAIRRGDVERSCSGQFDLSNARLRAGFPTPPSYNSKRI